MKLSSRQQRLLREFATIARFGIVGVSAAVVHASVAVGLLELLHVPPMLSNIGGFLVAFIVSFTGHHAWSFRSADEVQTGQRMRRFFVLAAAGFVLNNGALAALLKFTQLPGAVGIIIAIFVVPPLTFLGARLWAFAEPSNPNSR
ncbi:GtrA family protein [Pannonibacter phragmitetus]|uniref:GtrA family protein n=1 Tax=Pannonibacter phragmitetus TaxID=121719 RepID=UPI003D2F4236